MTLFVDHPIRNFRISEMKTYREQKSKKLGHYLLGQILGQGGFASVYKVQDIHSKQVAAGKFMKIPLQSDATIRKIDEEVQILRIVDHPNIVRIYETFQNQANYVIITQLIRGKQLFEYVCNNGPLQEPLAARIFHQIVSAVKYLHQREIVHRDIKTENIMIDQNFNAKLIDFGLATKYKKGNLLSTMCGSPSYVAPQMLEKKQYDGTKVDIWCLGVVLYVLLEANLPFDNKTEQQRTQNIKKMKWYTAHISSPEAIQLYQKIFKPSNERIDMDGLLNSAFFKKYYLNDIQNEYSPQFSKKEQCQVINQIQRILEVNEQAVKKQVQEKKLGTIYALYNLMMKKKKKMVSQILKRDSKTLELKHNTSRSSNQQQGKREKQTGFLKLQKVQTKLSSTPKPRRSIVKQIEPNLKNSLKITLKTDDLKKSLLAESGLFAEEKGKVRGRELYRGKKIFGHKIEVQKKKEIQIKPRLREESPQSPKRILDCLRKYN